MASSKDTFESDTFSANTFACGAWRGAGVDFYLPVDDWYPLKGASNEDFELEGSRSQAIPLKGT